LTSLTSENKHLRTHVQQLQRQIADSKNQIEQHTKEQHQKDQNTEHLQQRVSELERRLTTETQNKQRAQQQVKSLK